MIDRELYLSRSWADDDQRRADAGVPADIEFLTKPVVATGMICRALDAGAPTRWVAGDEVHGADPALRGELEIRRIGYVLAIGCDRRVPTAFGLIRADTLTARLPNERGSGSPPEPGRRASATTTGRWLRCSHPWRPWAMAATPRAGGCWCVVTAAPGSWRSIAATARNRCNAGRCSRCSPTPCPRSSPRTSTMPGPHRPG